MNHSGHESLQPFKFELNLKNVLWGGDKIAALKGVPLGSSHVGESWEVSGLPGRESVVAAGDDMGKNLRELIDEYRGRLVGGRVYRRYGNEFPLLVKFIDAKKDLSVQVHPDEKLARRRHNCSGKAEMWFIINADEDASLVAGLHKSITRKDFLTHVKEGTLLDVLERHATHRGDCFFLPAGRIHSIGAGNLLCEVQQASDITYRVYDYNRRDANGELRQLHTALAAGAIDYSVKDDVRCHYTPVPHGSVTLLDNEYFHVSLVNVDGHHLDVAMPDDAFLILTCLQGRGEVLADGHATPLHAGESVLVPACTTALALRGTMQLLTSTV